MADIVFGSFYDLALEWRRLLQGESGVALAAEPTPALP